MNDAIYMLKFTSESGGETILKISISKVIDKSRVLFFLTHGVQCKNFGFLSKMISN